MVNAWRLVHIRRFSRFAGKWSTGPTHKRLAAPSSGGHIAGLSLFDVFKADPFWSSGDARSCNYQAFSSAPAFERKEIDEARLAEVLSKVRNSDEMQKELEALGFSLDEETILSVLKMFDGEPDVARRFFNWVLELDCTKLSSNTYNEMLSILGRKESVDEFWDFLEVMKRQRYRMSKKTFAKASENFEQEGLDADLDKLKNIFRPNGVEDSIKNIFLKGSNADEIKKELEAVGPVDHEMIISILQSPYVMPEIAWNFFNRVVESGDDKLCSKSYNLMLRILGTKEHVEEFWDLVEVMMNKGFEISEKTHQIVSQNFEKEGMFIDLNKFKGMYRPVEEVFSKAGSSDDIKTQLEALGLSLNHDMILKVLRNLGGSPESARTFFNWVSDKDSSKLSSKSYNLMLEALGKKEHVTEFWDLVGIMKKKGYGISKRTYVEVTQAFEREGMDADLNKLKEIFIPKQVENSGEKMHSKVCKVVMESELGSEVEKNLKDLDLMLTSDLVCIVLEQLSVCPKKAYMFFKWTESDPAFKNDARAYNMMAQVLGRDDCIVEFWAILDEMDRAGYELELQTYINVLRQFYKRKMIKEAVDLYEYMMSSPNKAPYQDALFLLKKIVAGKELDMELFSRVVQVFNAGGHLFTTSTFRSVFKSLIGAGRLGDCSKILKAMGDGGFIADRTVLAKVVFGLCKAGNVDEACDFFDNLENSGEVVDLKLWVTLIDGLSSAGRVDKAISWFQAMVDQKGVENTISAFEILVDGYCREHGPHDACKFFSKMVTENQLKPQHSTYKMFIGRLLHKGCLTDAMSLLGVMKSHGFPPFVDPFISYISKHGTGDDAITFLKAMTLKRFPSTSVFLHMLEALLEVGRHNVAHDLLSKAPRYIRGHADVLELFASMKPKEQVLRGVPEVIP